MEKYEELGVIATDGSKCFIKSKQFKKFKYSNGLKFLDAIASLALSHDCLSLSHKLICEIYENRWKEESFQKTIERTLI